LKDGSATLSAESITQLGYFYKIGINGFTQSDRKAFEYYRRAAELGNEVAMSNLPTFIGVAGKCLSRALNKRNDIPPCCTIGLCARIPRVRAFAAGASRAPGRPGRGDLTSFRCRTRPSTLTTASWRNVPRWRLGHYARSRAGPGLVREGPCKTKSTEGERNEATSALGKRRSKHVSDNVLS
jgi:TPR repeat protein